MSLVVSGVSHHTSDVALRDRLTFSEESLPGALLALRERIADAGADCEHVQPLRGLRQSRGRLCGSASRNTGIHQSLARRAGRGTQ